MRRLLSVFLVLGLLSVFVRAEEKPAVTAADKALAELKTNYKDAQAKYIKEVNEQKATLQKTLEDAKGDDEKKEIKEKLTKLGAPGSGPGQDYALKFLAFAKENAKDKTSLEALKLAMQSTGGPLIGPIYCDGAWSKILNEIAANHLSDPEIRSVMRQLSAAVDESSEKLLRQVATKSTDRKTQALAFKALASGKEQAVKLAEQLPNNKQLRDNIEARFGKDFAAKIIADADKNKKTVEEARKALKDNYTDIFPDLSIGKAAPEVLIKDINDKEAKLSELKGKVVVLDIWATWCPPCRAMIPHERDMVEKLKDKPFVLVSISADAEKKTLTEFLEKEKMPWTHWWNGQQGGILEDWDVGHFPTIYVLDAKGVIRFKEIRGKELEEAVEQLLKETEKKDGDKKDGDKKEETK